MRMGITGHYRARHRFAGQIEVGPHFGARAGVREVGWSVVAGTTDR